LGFAAKKSHPPLSLPKQIAYLSALITKFLLEMRSILLALIFSVVSAKFVPGVLPNTFQDGDELPLFVDLLTSFSARIPFSHHSLAVCPSGTKGDNKKTGSIGDKLGGGEWKESGYNVHFREVEACGTLCKKTLTEKDSEKFKKLIKDEYRHNWYLDSLPAVMHSPKLDWVMRGFPVGFMDDEGLYYLYNHVRIVVRYHEEPTEWVGSRVVGVEIIPYSIDHVFDGDEPTFAEDGTLPSGAAPPKLKTCSTLAPAVNDPASFLKIDPGASVLWTYDVDWIFSDMVWSNRWDIYLTGNPDAEVHIFSLVNSLMVILFLSGIIAMILLRTLHKEISEYNELSTLEEAQEESGWKLVHADVFRPPQTHPMILAVACGTGVQIGVAIFFVMLCAVGGVIHATDKGRSLTTIILLYVFSGSFAGFNSARLYKFFGGKNWKKSTIGTAVAFPGVLLFLFFFLDFGLMWVGAATAVSFTTVISIFMLWICVSTPLVFVGSYFGFRKEVISTPLKPTLIARHVPEISEVNIFVGILLGGLLPFGSICIELFFIMSSLWLSQIYYVFGFLFAVLAILVLTCAEISIVMCYFQLCHEDYRWWWRSFLNTASTGGYLFAYSVWYFVTKLQIEGFLSALVYFTYNAMIALAFGLFCGAIGFYSSFAFVKKIYGSIKVD